MHPAIDSNKTRTCFLGFFFSRFVSWFIFVHYTYRVLCKLKNKHKDKIRISCRRLLEHNLAS